MVRLTLAVDKTFWYVGGTFVFSGVLEDDQTVPATPLPGQTVDLYINPSEFIGSAVTDSNGYYVIQWVADRLGTFVLQSRCTL